MSTEHNTLLDRRPATPPEAASAAVTLSRIYWAAFQASLDAIVGAGHGSDRSAAAHHIACKVMHDMAGNYATNHSAKAKIPAD